MRRFVEIALFTDDVGALTAFYRRALDCEPRFAAPDIAVFDVDGLKLLLHRRVEAAPGEPPGIDHFAIGVDDAGAAAGAIGEVELDAREYDWGRSAYLRDPDGRLVELHETS